ncbi:MAG: hypothetical protein QXW97_01675 [Candidatus Pacearchaeota archaeon]
MITTKIIKPKKTLEKKFKSLKKYDGFSSEIFNETEINKRYLKKRNKELGKIIQKYINESEEFKKEHYEEYMQARYELAEINDPYALYIVKKRYDYLKATNQEKIQAARLGIFRATKDYNPKYNFSVYANNKIRAQMSILAQEISDSKNAVHIPLNSKSKIFKLEFIENKLKEKLKREPTTEELSDEYNDIFKKNKISIKKSEIEIIKKFIKEKETYSIERDLYDYINKKINTQTKSPLEILICNEENESIKNICNKFLQNLNSLEREIFYLKFGELKNKKEIIKTIKEKRNVKCSKKSLEKTISEISEKFIEKINYLITSENLSSLPLLIKEAYNTLKIDHQIKITVLQDDSSKTNIILEEENLTTNFDLIAEYVKKYQTSLKKCKKERYKLINEIKKSNGFINPRIPNKAKDALEKIFKLSSRIREEIKEKIKYTYPKYVHESDIETGITNSLIHFCDNYDSEKYPKEECLKNYLYSVLHKGCKWYIMKVYPKLRKRRYTKTLTIEQISKESLENFENEEEIQTRINQALNTLSDSDKKFLFEYMIKGKTHNDISKENKISLEASWQRISRIRKRLKISSHPSLFNSEISIIRDAIFRYFVKENK